MHFHCTTASGVHKEGEFRGLCVCVCFDLHTSGLILVISNKLDSNDNRYECNPISFNSGAILCTYQH